MSSDSSTPSVFLEDPDVTIWNGDALETLRGLPDESVHCVATSPPFFGLRDYGVDGQIGLEASPDLWAARLVEVFREARRVLREDGSLWIECGDSYGSGGHNGKGYVDGGEQTALIGQKWSKSPFKPKDLIGQPFLLAFALRADGWYWRGVNIWAKPNAMPESAKDRCTVAHSYVLHFSKKARYWFDGDAISEPAAWERWGDQTVPKHNGTPTATGWMEPKTKDELPVAPTKPPRSVWTISTQGFPEAHFATWPEALARRILLAACPEQVCGTCGKARERITDVAYTLGGAGGGGARRESADSGASYTMPVRKTKHTTQFGFTDCGHDNYQPGVVLDPFGGSGTTALVARKHGRRAILIELNAEYCEMAARRLAQQSLLTELAS